MQSRGTYDRARRGRACPTRLAAIFIAFGLVSAAPVHIDDTRMREQYRSRRIELRKSLADGVIVLFGRADQDEDLRTGFFQESNFFYLTGWREPGAILVMAPLPDESTAPGYAARE